MTPRQYLHTFTEDTKISLGVVLLGVGLLVGAIVWMTTTSIQASQAAEAAQRIEKKQDAYSDELQEIKLSLQEIAGELKRIRR